MRYEHSASGAAEGIATAAIDGARAALDLTAEPPGPRHREPIIPSPFQNCLSPSCVACECADSSKLESFQKLQKLIDITPWGTKASQVLKIGEEGGQGASIRVQRLCFFGLER